jgi:uncharacterized membrane protein SpoIIM required for sporulation
MLLFICIVIYGGGGLLLAYAARHPVSADDEAEEAQEAQEA